MSLQPYALVSLADFKDTLNLKGDSKDEVIERAINSASRLIEADLGRRLRYRAPEEVAGGANIVASVALTNGALTVADQPAGSRTIIVSITDTDRSVRSGTVTVTGTVDGVAGTTEVFDLSAQQARYHGRKFFTAISGIVVASASAPVAQTSDLIAVGTSLGMVEYHDPRGCARIQLREWPVYAFAEINEDPNRVYAAATALDADDDYQYSASGEVTRVDTSGLPFAFWSGYRAIKVRYSAGYGSISTVPPDLKDVCLRLAGTKYKEWERGALGITGMSDQLGNYTRIGAAALTNDMRDDLATYRRSDLFTTTAERDFDEEAA